LPIAVYPGSFDPMTNGHLDIATRASALFDKLIIAVYDAPPKRLLFTTEERVQLWEEALPKLPNVTVEKYVGLTVDLARNKNATVIVRGLREISDFQNEFDMALTNKKMAPEIEEVFLMSAQEYLFTSSTRAKEVWGLGGFVKDLVPSNVDIDLRKKIMAMAAIP